MAVTGEEIRARLSAFAARWSVYDGTERSGAQTFLNELFDCYGTERQAVGLTKLYNQVDEGAWKDLRDLHVELDEAVAEAYGWPKSVAQDPEESNRRLLELNRAIAAGEIDYKPFVS